MMKDDDSAKKQKVVEKKWREKVVDLTLILF